MAITRGGEKDTPQPGVGAVAVTDLSYSDAGAQLDAIIEEFETGVVDVDRLVEQLERATDIVDELDRRLRRTRMRVEELVPRLESIGQVDEGLELEIDEIAADGDRNDDDGDGEGGIVPPVDRDGKTPGLF
jgi:exodeoxyribonuclease VII small subunit